MGEQDSHHGGRGGRVICRKGGVVGGLEAMKDLRHPNECINKHSSFLSARAYQEPSTLELDRLQIYLRPSHTPRTNYYSFYLLDYAV
jgi:hypothetical protein